MISMPKNFVFFLVGQALGRSPECHVPLRNVIDVCESYGACAG
jgi:hypothetical protein